MVEFMCLSKLINLFLQYFFKIIVFSVIEKAPYKDQKNNKYFFRNSKTLVFVSYNSNIYNIFSKYSTSLNKSKNTLLKMDWANNICTFVINN